MKFNGCAAGWIADDVQILTEKKSNRKGRSNEIQMRSISPYTKHIWGINRPLFLVQLGGPAGSNHSRRWNQMPAVLRLLPTAAKEAGTERPVRENLWGWSFITGVWLSFGKRNITRKMAYVPWFMGGFLVFFRKTHWLISSCMACSGGWDKMGSPINEPRSYGYGSILTGKMVGELPQKDCNLLYFVHVQDVHQG